MSHLPVEEAEAVLTMYINRHDRLGQIGAPLWSVQSCGSIRKSADLRRAGSILQQPLIGDTEQT